MEKEGTETKATSQVETGETKSTSLMETEMTSASQMESQEKKEETDAKSTEQADKEETDAKSTEQADKEEANDSDPTSIAQIEKQEETVLEQSVQIKEQEMMVDTDTKSTQLEKKETLITRESEGAGIEGATGTDGNGEDAKKRKIIKVPERRAKFVRMESISPTTVSPIPYNPTSEGGAAAVIDVTGSEELDQAVRRVRTDQLISSSTLSDAGIKGAVLECRTFQFLGENQPLHMRKIQVQTFERAQNKRYRTQLKNHTYKILIVGDAGTGKTSIMRRFASGRYDGNYQVTIGVDYFLKVVYLDDCTTVRLELWDIAGSERAIPLTRAYYRDAYGAFVVSDMTNYSTLDSSVLWKKDIDSKVLLPNGTPIPCVLLFNKYDKRKSILDLLKEEQRLDKFCEHQGFHKWFYTSAKEDINIQEAFMALIEKMMSNEKEVGKIKRSSDIIRPRAQPRQTHANCCQ